MKFKLEIDMGNDAFAELPESEVCRILQELSSRIEFGDADANRTISLYDGNGNKVGEARFVG